MRNLEQFRQTAKGAVGLVELRRVDDQAVADAQRVTQLGFRKRRRSHPPQVSGHPADKQGIDQRVQVFGRGPANVEGDDLALGGARHLRSLHLGRDPRVEVIALRGWILSNHDRLRRMLGADRLGRLYSETLFSVIGRHCDERHDAIARMGMLVIAGLRVGKGVADVAQRAQHVADRHILPLPLRIGFSRCGLAHGRCHSLPPS